MIRKYLCLMSFVFLFFTASAELSTVLAQDVGVEAVVDRNQVALGESLRLTITITGTTNVDELDINTLQDFDIRYLGPRTNVTIVNGQYSSAKSFVYNLFPSRTGEFTIEPLKFTIKGVVYASNPIVIRVVDSGSNSAHSHNTANGESTATSLNDNLYVVIQTAKDEVFVNEAVPVKILLFASGVEVRDIRFPELEQLGFTMTDFAKPRQGQQMINGKRFDIVEFNTTIFPTRTGDVLLGPVSLECNVIYRSERSNSSLRGNIFDDDFFNGFFNRVETQPMRLQSKVKNLKVKSLPETERPSDFSGAVGEFEFQASASPQAVRVGDPITFKMNVSGNGNLAAVNFPRIKDSRFKQYDPIIKEENGVKVYEQVLIPTSKEVKQVPGVQFSYFDPVLGKYRSIVRGPFDVSVEEGERGVSFYSTTENTVGLSESSDSVGEDIIFIKEMPGRLKRMGNSSGQSFGFYFIFFFGVLLWSCGFVWIKREQKFQLDPAFKNKLLAFKIAQKELNGLKRRFSSIKDDSFYDLIYKILQNYFAAKLNLQLGKVTARNVAQCLLEKSVDAQAITQVRLILEECEHVRYAGALKTIKAPEEYFTTVEDMINQVEKILR